MNMEILRKGMIIPMTESEMEKIQLELSDKIIDFDMFQIENIKNVAGVDLAYWKNDNREFAVCCIVIVDIDTHEMIESKSVKGEITFPYIPGFLAFRELPLILKTVELLENKPDLYMFDGNGYLHPRHMGIATHASFYLDKPCIGVAKKYFKVGNTDYILPDSKAGSYTDITVNGEVYGRALRTMDNVKPVFVSVGNFITLDTAVKIVMRFTDKESHIPVPTRIADAKTRAHRAKLLSQIG
ncbi:MAG: endonuclease V [Oscillospiraceae bacterium]|nr:endonuclease V [Oscillospiraceae bacterium]